MPLRLSDADRDALIALLGRHLAAGSIDTAELERRVEIVARAVTRDDAQPALGDLPVLPPPAGAGGDGDPRGRGAATGGAGSGGTTSRRRRGHGDADRVAADWQPTTERFRDPSSGRVMRVWVDAGGGRHYVPDDGQPGVR